MVSGGYDLPGINTGTNNTRLVWELLKTEKPLCAHICAGCVFTLRSARLGSARLGALQPAIGVCAWEITLTVISSHQTVEQRAVEPNARTVRLLSWLPGAGDAMVWGSCDGDFGITQIIVLNKFQRHQRRRDCKPNTTCQNVTQGNYKTGFMKWKSESAIDIQPLFNAHRHPIMTSFQCNR